jgi:hypothetical protein
MEVSIDSLPRTTTTPKVVYSLMIQHSLFPVSSSTQTKKEELGTAKKEESTFPPRAQET